MSDKDKKMIQGQNDSWIIHFVSRLPKSCFDFFENFRLEYRNQLSPYLHDLFDYFTGQKPLSELDKKDKEKVRILEELVKSEAGRSKVALSRIYKGEF